jgi:hypothetical protein
LDNDGVEYTERGTYLLCDGGYMSWTISIFPQKICSEVNEVHFSHRLESIRKDIDPKETMGLFEDSSSMPFSERL